MAWLVEPSDGAALAPPGFSLQAERLRLETDHADLAFPQEKTSVHPSTTPPEYFSAARLTGIAARTGQRLLLFPLAASHAPRLDSLVGCGSLQGSDMASPDRIPRVQAGSVRSNLTWDVSSTSRLQKCSREIVSIQGDFRLSLYEWDAVLSTNGQTRQVYSGHQSATPSGLPDVSGVVASVDEVYLYAWNATLTMATPRAVDHLFLAQAQVATQGTVVVGGASGHVSLSGHTIDLNGESLTLRGTTILSATGSGVNQPIQVHAAGNLESASLGGLALSLTTTPASSMWMGWVGGGLAVVGLVAVPVLRSVRLRSARPLGRRRSNLENRIDDLLCRRDYREALPLARKMLDWMPQSPLAHCNQAKILSCLGQPRQALSHFEEAREILACLGTPDHALAGENAFEAARATILLHRQATGADRQNLRGAALIWMREALQANPALLVDMEMEHELRPLVHELVPEYLVSPIGAEFA